MISPEPPLSEVQVSARGEGGGVNVCKETFAGCDSTIVHVNSQQELHEIKPRSQPGRERGREILLLAE